MIATLIALDVALAKRVDFWHSAQEDPHGIASAMVVALSEIREAIREVIENEAQGATPKAAFDDIAIEVRNLRIETTGELGQLRAAVREIEPPGSTPPRDIYNPQDKL